MELAPLDIDVAVEAAHTELLPEHEFDLAVRIIKKFCTSLPKPEAPYEQAILYRWITGMESPFPSGVLYTE